MSKKISELSAAGALTGTEVIPVVQNGNTVKTTAQDIANLGGGASTTKVYRALLSQAMVDGAVTATVLENTLGGDVVWSAVSDGVSSGVLANAFTVGKTAVYISNKLGVVANTVVNVTGYDHVDADTINVSTVQVDPITPSILADTLKTAIEILVYP